MKDTIYFQHDFNAQDDPKIIKLRMIYGREGYGLFWALLEYMRGEEDISLKEKDCNAFAFRSQYDIEKLNKFLLFCTEIGLFIYDKEDRVYYSERLQTNVERMRIKSKKAKKSADVRWHKREKKNANALPTQSEGNAIQYIQEKKGKESEESEQKIIPPLLPPPIPKNTLKQEIENARQEIPPGFDIYLEGFINYRSEKDKKGNEKWTKEKTRELNKRLVTWKKNDETNFGRIPIVDYTKQNNFKKALEEGKSDLLKNKFGIEKFNELKKKFLSSN